MSESIDSQAWTEFFTGKTDALACGEGPSGAPSALLPGAFNPLHRGHLRMAELAADLLSARVGFEISIENVDKPPLDPDEAARRVGQFPSGCQVWLTRAPTFLEKSRLFPRATFIVGADTILRVGDVRYYQAEERFLDAMAQIAQRQCRFLVFGRQVGSEFCTLRGLDLPASLAELCLEAPADLFRDDISSTELRLGSAPPKAP